MSFKIEQEKGLEITKNYYYPEIGLLKIFQASSMGGQKLGNKLGYVLSSINEEW